MIAAIALGHALLATVLGAGVIAYVTYALTLLGQDLDRHA
jgi:hypothetical protein